MKKLRLLIVDAQEIFRAGLRVCIQAQPDMEIVGEASERHTAWQRTQELLPDVVIIDIAVWDIDGMQATVRLSHLCATARVLLVTAHADARQVQRMLQDGAAGYVLKHISADELLRAIRTVAAGDIYLDPTIAGNIVANYLHTPTPAANVPVNPLSPRESEVLRLLAWGYSHKDMAARLGISVKTIETYKTRLMHKLHLHSRVDLVHYAARQGWLQES